MYFIASGLMNSGRMNTLIRATAVFQPATNNKNFLIKTPFKEHSLMLY
jgi:hypothetical protein